MDIKAMLKKSGSVIGLVALFVVISCLNSSFIDPSNLKNLLRQVSINALISFGMTFVILTGGIDLSVGSITALTGMFVAIMMKNWNIPVAPAIIIAVLSASLLGLINGVGDTVYNMIVAIADGVAARLVLSLLLGFTAGMGALGFYLGNCLAGFVSVLGGGLYFLAGWWKKKGSLVRHE